MISFIATLNVKPDQAAAFEAAMQTVVPKVRQEPGNHAYIFHRSATKPHTYYFYEQYTDEDAVKAHRAHLGTLGINLAEMLAAAPQIEHWELIM